MVVTLIGQNAYYMYGFKWSFITLDIVYSGLFSNGGTFYFFRIVEHHQNNVIIFVSFTKKVRRELVCPCKRSSRSVSELFYHNRFNITILSCMNIEYEILIGQFIRKFAPTKITCYIPYS